MTLETTQVKWLSDGDGAWLCLKAPLRDVMHAAEAPIVSEYRPGTYTTPVTLRIPADSETGRKLRLRGRGLPGSGGMAAGDQIVELEVLAPRADNHQRREAYERLRDAFGSDWRRV